MTTLPDSAAEPAWVADVLRFWLEETPSEARFKRNPELDAAIRQRFAGVHQALLRAPPDAPALTPRQALAAIIVLDQFSRNMFRGQPEAFAGDASALRIAKHAVATGFDRSLDKDGRLFLYLPFEHAEDLALQDRSVALIGALDDPQLDAFAVAHRDIIRRFGRFPHRNAALGRPSTVEEIAFLTEPGSSF